MAQSWTFVGAGAVNTSNDPFLVPPTGTQAGDLLVAVCTSSAVYSLTPTGWTQAVRNTTAAPFLSVWYKFAGASEGSTTVSNASTASAGQMLGWRGISALDVVSTVTTATATSLASGTVTTTAADDLLLSVFGSALAASNNWTTTITGTTNRGVSNTSASLTGFLVNEEDKATAGATTARTGVSAASTAKQAYQIAFKQSSTAPSFSGATTDATDIYSASVGPVVAASSAKTDGADVSAFSGGPVVAASSATTEGADVLAASVAPVAPSVSSATTDGADVLAGNVGPLVGASSAKTDGADTLAANASPVVGASSATTDGADVLAAQVDVVSSTPTFSGATTDAADTLVSAVGPVVGFSADGTDGADVLSAAVDPVPAAASFSSAWVDGADVLLGHFFQPSEMHVGGDDAPRRKLKKRKDDELREQIRELVQGKPIAAQMRATVVPSQPKYEQAPVTVARIQPKHDDEEEALLMMI